MSVESIVPHGPSPSSRPLRHASSAARLLSRPAGMWRVPHGVGVPGHIAYVPYRVLGRVSVTRGYDARGGAA